MKRIASSRAALAVWALTVLHILFYGAFNSLRILACTETTVDFAGAEQGLWQLAFGRDQFNTVYGAHNFVNHVYGLHFLIAPLFRLCSSPHLLAWLQVVGLSLGAPVLFRFARLRSNNEWLASGCALVWLMSPVIVHLSALDYYGVFPVATLLLLLLDQLHRDARRLGKVILLSLLTLACEESVAPTIGMLGVYTMWRLDRRAGAALVFMASAWFLSIALVVIPALNQGHSTPHLAMYAAYGDTPGAILRTTVTRPGFVLGQVWVKHNGAPYLYQLFSIGGFFSLLAPEVLAVDLLDFLAKLMPDYRGPHTFGRHYGLLSMPILYWSVIEGAIRLRRLLLQLGFDRAARVEPSRVDRAVLALLLAFALPSCAANRMLPVSAFGFMMKRAFSEQAIELRRVCRSVPPDVGVVASPTLLLHLAHRPIAYSYPNPFMRSAWDGRPSDPDYGKYIIDGELTPHLDRGDDVDWIVLALSATAADLSRAESLPGMLIRSGKFRLRTQTQYAVILERS